MLVNASISSPLSLWHKTKQKHKGRGLTWLMVSGDTVQHSREGMGGLNGTTPCIRSLSRQCLTS